MNKMLIRHPFWAVSAEPVLDFFVKIAPKSRYKNVNRGLISRGCSLALIHYFPLIARVHRRVAMNKIGTK